MVICMQELSFQRSPSPTSCWDMPLLLAEALFSSTPQAAAVKAVVLLEHLAPRRPARGGINVTNVELLAFGQRPASGDDQMPSNDLGGNKK